MKALLFLTVSLLGVLANAYTVTGDCGNDIQLSERVKITATKPSENFGVIGSGSFNYKGHALNVTITDGTVTGKENSNIVEVRVTDVQLNQWLSLSQYKLDANGKAQIYMVTGMPHIDDQMSLVCKLSVQK